MQKISLVHEGNRLLVVYNKEFFKYRYQLMLIGGVALLLAGLYGLTLSQFSDLGIWLRISIPLAGFFIGVALWGLYNTVNKKQRVYTFDRSSNTIMVGAATLAPLTEVDAVTSRHHSSRYGSSFTIRLLLKNGRLVTLGNNLDYTEAEDLAGEIAKYVGVDVVRT